ncbi:MAG: DUF3822 family protein [Bacteroidaceae bacterium]|nr:DUF3822 family protein [Bacteroidaceae bacterium]
MPYKGLHEKIDFSKSDQYTLSIRFSSDGFSYMIYDPTIDYSLSFSEMNLHTTESYLANATRLLHHPDLIEHTYKRINIIHVSKRFTLIPTEFYQKELSEDYFYHNHPRVTNEQVLYNALPLSSIVVAHGIQTDLFQLIEQTYPTATIYSHVCPLIEFLHNASKHGNKKKMYINYRSKEMDVFCYNRGQLLLSNTFQTKSIEDQVYYLLYIWQQLSFNQERDEMRLVGFIPEKEQLLNKLRYYVKNVFVINPKAEYMLLDDSITDTIPFDLQSLLQCEL